MTQGTNKSKLKALSETLICLINTELDCSGSHLTNIHPLSSAALFHYLVSKYCILICLNPDLPQVVGPSVRSSNKAKVSRELLAPEE